MLRDNEKLRKLRAMEMVKKVVYEGKTKKETAREMGLSAEKVGQELKWAEEANQFVTFEQKIYSELLPLAHEALRLALEDGDASVALEIYKGTNLLKKGTQGRKAVEEEDNLYGEIGRLRAGGVVDVTPAKRIDGPTYRELGPAPGGPVDPIESPAATAPVEDGDVLVGRVHRVTPSEASNQQSGSEDAASTAEGTKELV